MKNIVFINASPKTTDKSLSKHLNEMVSREFDRSRSCQSFIEPRKSLANHTTLDDFNKLTEADAVVIAFPLYFYGLPGILMRFLEDYYQFTMVQGKPSKNPKVYAIINCGFPEPEINRDALRVIGSFCRQINAQFRFGVLIGGGGMLLETKEAGFMKKTKQTLEKAFAKIAQDTQDHHLEKIDTIHIVIKFPKVLFKIMGSLNWIQAAHKNGLKKKDLYRQPYRLYLDR